MHICEQNIVFPTHHDGHMTLRLHSIWTPELTNHTHMHLLHIRGQDLVLLIQPDELDQVQPKLHCDGLTGVKDRPGQAARVGIQQVLEEEALSGVSDFEGFISGKHKNRV